MEKNKFKISFTNISIILVLLFWLIISVAFFVYSTQENATVELDETLESVANNNAHAVSDVFDKYINIMLLTSDFVRNADYDITYFEQVFNDLVLLDDFSSVVVVLPDDTSYLTNGTTLAPSDYVFTEDMANGKIFISDVYYDKHISSDAVSINVPLFSPTTRELIAYVCGVLKTTTLSQTFNESFYDVGGYYLLLDSNGDYVAISDSEIMFAGGELFPEVIAKLSFIDGYDSADLLNSFQSREQGLTKYKNSNEHRTAYYTPVKINNWVMFLAIPENIISEKININLLSTMVLIANIILVFVFLLVWVYNSQRKLITFAKESEQNVRFVSERTKKYIVELDFVEEEIKITGRLPDVFGVDSASNIVSMDMAMLELIYTEDALIAEDAFNALQRGKEVSKIKFRINHLDGEYVWCMFSGIPIETKKRQSKFTRAMGFIENIDLQEKESAKLKQMSQLDSLTQIHNKGATESLIESTLANSNVGDDRHSLIIIDLDNFKALNDTFGHQFGDDVIKELANFIKKLFRQNDVVGRIGGDEFFVFMKDTYSKDHVVDKCEVICRHFDKEYEKNGKTVRISASIGIAYYPDDGNSFVDLYKNSDIALYHAKKLGKNNYQFYDGRTDIEYISNRTDIDNPEDYN